jgi:hypothetical protein
MDIVDFYDGDPRRRGDDVLLGADWRDRMGRRWRVSWIPRTNELVAIHHPDPSGYAYSPFPNGYTPHHTTSGEMMVEVLATVERSEALDEIVSGSERWRRRRGGLERLHRRLRRLGIASAPALAYEPPRGCLYWFAHPTEWVDRGMHACGTCGRTMMRDTPRCPFCGTRDP